ncbi:MAG: DUF6431 domain-containing protein [Spirochaetia bacterium]|nr:DUF6431 domain-containing protein [Spirochaetia bacterium]
MFLEIAVEFIKVQVLSTEISHPECSLFGIIFCPCCGKRLHGHGWRQRYFIDADLKEFLIWIHRKHCPNCGMTFTLLPKWVHAFKCFSVELIQQVLHAAFTTGHLGNRYQVNRTLQRTWRTQYIARSSLETNYDAVEFTKAKKSIIPDSCLASPLKLQILTQKLHGKMEALSFKPPGPHHHLLLFIPMCLL